MAGEPPVPVFDVGGVLIDWDPRHLYRRLIADEAARERFLAEVCPPAWNLEMDRGRPWAVGVAERVALFPDQAALIRAFDARWPEMVAGAFVDTVALFEALLATGRPVYGITNFSVAKFAIARCRFPFLARFAGIVVSGEEGLVKPDPAIYRRLLSRHGLAAGGCLFIDDVAANVDGARAAGMQAVQYTGAAALRAELVGRGLLPETAPAAR
jgi:2-haloacid dehalogenase